MKQAACIMVWGTHSGAGKSWLTTALCRYYQQQGLRVAPFKAQNMSGNSRPLMLANGQPGEMAAAQFLQQTGRTGVPTVGVLPMLADHGLPAEDGWDLPAATQLQGRQRVGVLAWPRAAHLDALTALGQHRQVALFPVRSAEDVAAADVLLLPHTLALMPDLAWLRERKLDAALAQHAGQGKGMVALGAGLQMLAEGIVDVNSIAGNGPGLGLLPLVTALAEQTQPMRPFAGQIGPVSGPWAALSGLPIQAQQLALGEIALHPAMVAAGVLAQELLPAGLGWANAAGNVLGFLLADVLESEAVLEALFGPGALPQSWNASFDVLAAQVENAMGAAFLHSLLQPPRPQA